MENVVKANIMDISRGRGVVNTCDLPTFFSSVEWNYGMSEIMVILSFWISKQILKG